VNRRKEHGRLEPQQCRALEHAWIQADKDGFPLNAKIAIRPAEHLTPERHVALVNTTWNRLGVWSRRHTPNKTFHAVLVRETVPIEHFHILMHVAGGGNPSLLRYALSRWFPEPGVAHVTRAHQHVTYTQSGKINSAIGYITKERTPQVWRVAPISKRARGVGHITARL